MQEYTTLYVDHNTCLEEEKKIETVSLEPMWRILSRSFPFITSSYSFFFRENNEHPSYERRKDLAFFVKVLWNTSFCIKKKGKCDTVIQDK